MNVTKFFVISFVFSSFFLFSQKKTDYFLLENNNVEYSYSIDEKEKIITLFSKEGNFLISFKIKKEKAYCCRGIDNFKNYKWIIDNLTILYKEKGEDILEVNTFKGLVFILKSNFKCYVVDRRIIEEYD